MRRKVLAASSQGGHWKQLSALMPVFESCETSFASTLREQPTLPIEKRYFRLPEANRNAPLQCLWLFFAAGWLVLRLRPEVVISTGALPGLACIFWGRLTGARTLWIDSIANADRLSLSGRMARHIATKTLSQWPDLGREAGVEYRGAVL
ncbi:hypothetical protein Maes01_02103 [Microbulbifer aestuariivivens]|uniref:UDP-N-acetylglucosamine--LPS N-acetylglucosamine transferase n=1 Tax=Microbulbifer aestuariivivens TaxID=1908308 RepID=A0ABP9WTE0_9GAMM